MKVRDLIKELQKRDQESEVWVEYIDSESGEEVFEVAQVRSVPTQAQYLHMYTGLQFPAVVLSSIITDEE